MKQHEKNKCFITNKLHNKLYLSTYTGDYSNMFRLFIIVIFREHWYTKELIFNFLGSKWQSAL
jgi:hypothetical protein